MVKSPRWVRRAALTAALLGALGLAIPSPVSSPLSQVAANGSPDSPDGGSPNDAGASPFTEAVDGSASSQVEGDEAAPLAPTIAAPAQISAPGDASPVRLTPDHAACGEGFTAQEFLGEDPFAVCTHSYEDPAPTRSPRNGASRVAPVCQGNGVNGARIQLVYMYLEGQPNRGAEWIPRILNEWVPAMEGAFRTTSKEQGREIGMRLHMPGCKLQVTTLEISEDAGRPDGGQFSRIVNAVRSSRINATDRKFHVWFDGPSSGPCGIAQALLVPVVGDNPTPANVHNFGYDFGYVPQVAVSFKLPFPLPNFQAIPPICWGNGAMGAVTETHEVLHTLGAVGLTAPNSNGLGHCRDDLDIMCYSEGGVMTVPRCAIQVELLDCGADDYFNARPPVGSYLSRNWNTANSRYLGTALEDMIPAELPRP